jgi:hypothetical protein
MPSHADAPSAPSGSTAISTIDDTALPTVPPCTATASATTEQTGATKIQSVAFLAYSSRRSIGGSPSAGPVRSRSGAITFVAGTSANIQDASATGNQFTPWITNSQSVAAVGSRNHAPITSRPFTATTIGVS